MAFDKTSGVVRRTAGLALVAKLSSAGVWKDLLAFCDEYGKSIGAEWKSERPRLEAYEALGGYAELKALATRLSTAYPTEAAKDADALAYFAAVADEGIGGKTWIKSFQAIAPRTASLRLDEPRILPDDDRFAAQKHFPPEELHALAMRDAVSRKDYGLAYKEALLGPVASMGRLASPAMISDAGKAFLYSGSLKEGEAKFSALGWTARFYRAKFAMALERLPDAAALFKKVAADAPTPADADAALWYAADCDYRAALAAAVALAPAQPTAAATTAAPPPAAQATAQAALLAKASAEAAAREAALDELAADSSSWHDPAAFADLVNGLFRDALRARDWRLVENMYRRIADKLPTDTAARLAYASARAFELDLIDSQAPGPTGADPSFAENRLVMGDKETRASSVAVRFAAIADDPSAPLHYRALAAWRAGIEPTFVPPDSAQSGPDSAPAAPRAADAVEEMESFIDGIAAFGLYDIAFSEALSRRSALSDDALRRLASLFSGHGRADCALRLTVELVTRRGFQPRRSDYELLYPRPYLGELRSLQLKPAVPERLELGLVRSESLFRADVVSGAGAIGLSQLMPSTAASQAKAIGLSGYDLSDPKDNLAIGLAHFSSLLGRTEGKPLRAMMAYNAGWGRLKTWSVESGNLPDDLMIEALGIQETRQYCRNILQATVMYGALYYGKTVGETVGELVEGVKPD